MAVSIQNTAEGIADNTAPTIPNSGGTSGNAISSINVGAASTILAKTTAAIHGGRGFEFNLAGSTTDGATRMFWSASSPVGDRLVHSFYVNLSSTVTVFEDLGGVVNTAGTKIAVASIGADGKLIVADATGAYLSASRAANIFPTGVVRVDLAVMPNTATTTGYLGYQYYLGDSTTVVGSWVSTTANAGTAAINTVFIGRTTGRGQARVALFDTVRASAPVTAPTFMDPFTSTGGTSGSITQVGINTAEGLPVGTVLTSTSASSTGGASGTAASTINVGAASTISVSNFNVAHGSRGYAFDLAGNTADGATRILWPLVRSDRAVISVYVGSITQAITALEDLGGIRNSGGNMGVLTIGTDGKAILADAAGAAITASKSTNVIPTDTRIRFDISAAKGTTTANGTLGYAYFLNDSATPTFSYESAAQNAGTTDTATVFAGRSTGRANPNSIYYDTIRFGFGTAGNWFAPYVAPAVAPTADLGSDLTSIEPYSTVLIDGSGSAGSGTMTFTLTQTAGPTATVTGSGPTWTYVAPASKVAQTIRWQLTVTDSTSLTSAAVSASHQILPWDYLDASGNPIRTMIVVP